MFLERLVYCAVFVFVFELMSPAVGLREGDEGVCVGKISSMNRRKVYYTRLTNKWCGKRKCTVKASKAVPHVVVSNVMMCCSGWGYNAEREMCDPLCSTGCQGGRCVAPEQCQCDSPLYLDPEHKNICLNHLCDPPCFNADCFGNNTCKCHSNFYVHNSTHCHNCDHGFVIDENFSCVPKCDSPCVNGVCTSPNSCSCLPGYLHTDNFTCSPICDGCVNSVCVAPNTCACFEGYSAINVTHCAPQCENCSNGHCVSPNVCECNVGYEKINEICQPYCGGCENSVCSEPGVCRCNDGYQKNETNPNRCFKPCSKECPGICDIHGSCFCEEITKMCYRRPRMRNDTHCVFYVFDDYAFPVYNY